MGIVLSSGDYFGWVRRRSDWGDISLTETVYGPGCRIPRHHHECPYICVVLEGSYTERLAGRDRECRRSVLVFHPAGQRHSDVFHGFGGRCLNIELPTDSLEPAPWGPSAGPVGRGEQTASRWLIQSLLRCFTPGDTAFLDPSELGATILSELSGRPFSGGKGNEASWLLQARDLIHARASTSLRLAQIAEAVGVHAVHLARTFRDRYGCTVGEYVRHLRLQRARTALARTDAPLSQVAHSSGFADQSHLTRAFKDRFDLTPARYRRVVQRAGRLQP